MKKIDLGVIVTTLIIVTISCSLAFFAARIVGNPKDINLVAKNVSITFTDTSNIATNETISPGWNNVKTFTITNNSKEDFNYNILLKGLVNTFESINTLQYKITSDTGYNMDNYLNIVKTENSKDVVLAYDVVIPKGSKQTYQVEFKYISIDEDQSSDMGKKLGGTLAIEASTGKPKIYDKLLADNPTIKTRTDFNTTFTETNTGTLYKATESIAGKTSKDVYYFAGDAQNNWVKFAGFYWRIIRTNHDGIIRLLYSGTSPDTTSGYIGESAFNSSNNNSMYAGYMYGTSGSLDNNRTNKNNSTIKTYIDNWYSNNLSSYTKYISTEAVYCNDREVVGGSYVAEELNKNSNSMIAFVDINDTNNLIAIAAPDKHYNFRFSANIRLQDNKQPTYNCTNNKDAFSGSNTEAKLTYPIGLMTADEVVYAGADTIYAMDNFPSTASVWYFLNKNGTSITGNIDWWTITPSISTRPLGALSGNSIYLAYVDNASLYVPDVFQGPDSIYASLAVRPAISIKSCALWSSGNGSASSPYEISTTSGC